MTVSSAPSTELMARLVKGVLGLGWSEGGSPVGHVLTQPGVFLNHFSYREVRGAETKSESPEKHCFG